MARRSFCRDLRPFGVCFFGQLSSRPSPVGTNTLVCPRRRQTARRMFEPCSRGFRGAVARPAVLGLVPRPEGRWFFSALGRSQRPSGAWGGVTANRSLTVATPADGNRVLPSRAREQAVSSRSRSMARRSFCRDLRPFGVCFSGQLSSRPSPVGTNTLVCPRRRQTARRMFEPCSRGFRGAVARPAVLRLVPPPRAGGSFRRSAAPSGRAGPGVG